MIKNELKLILAAISFFTRISFSSNHIKNIDEETLQKSARYFTLIGILIGAVQALVFWGSSFLYSKQLSILFSMIATILLTGGFHEDGFADCCDGFGGGFTRYKILSIMKDSRVGAFGAIGICLILATKFFAIYEIPSDKIPAIIILGHIISRLSAISLVYIYPYVRDEAASKSNPVVKYFTGKDLCIAGIISIIPFFIIGNLTTFFALIPVFIFTFLLGYYFMKTIGGITGDCLGATQQVTEVIFYLQSI